MKNNADAIIFHTDICAENVTNISYPTRETAYADFSCGSSNVNVLRMEVSVKNYILAFRRAFDFKGRSSRKEYWSFFGINCVVYFILILLFELSYGADDLETIFVVIMLLYFLISIIPSISIAIRRVHDTNHAWYFILIPYFNIILMFMPGNNVCCPYCGNSVSENVKFCSSCGKSIQNKTENKVCPVCHKEYTTDMIYCEECGSKLQ